MKSSDIKITDIMVAIFTMLLVIVGALQVYWMYRTVTLTRSFERAFISPKLVLSHDELNKGVTIAVEWKNSGVTPTRHFNSHVSWNTFKGDMPKNFKFPDYWSKGESKENTESFIGPDASIFQQAYIPKENIDLIAAGKYTVYVWGWAEYGDIFENTKHRTEFCIKVIAISMANNFMYVNSLTCPRYNGADEELFSAKPV